MLILTRKCNEQLIIGDQIVVTVVAIRGGRVRLGIEAPANASVQRKGPREEERPDRVPPDGQEDGAEAEPDTW